MGVEINGVEYNVGDVVYFMEDCIRCGKDVLIKGVVKRVVTGAHTNSGVDMNYGPWTSTGTIIIEDRECVKCSLLHAAAVTGWTIPLRSSSFGIKLQTKKKVVVRRTNNSPITQPYCESPEAISAYDKRMHPLLHTTEDEAAFRARRDAILRSFFS